VLSVLALEEGRAKVRRILSVHGVEMQCIPQVSLVAPHRMKCLYQVYEMSDCTQQDQKHWQTRYFVALCKQACLCVYHTRNT